MTAGPTRLPAALLLVAAVALLALTPLAPAEGRVLLLPAALTLALVGARDLLLPSTVSADDEGVTVVDGWRRTSTPWSRVVRVRVVSDRRAPLLELDLGDRLVVLSRRRLGRSPQEVLEALLAVRGRATAAGRLSAAPTRAEPPQPPEAP